MKKKISTKLRLSKETLRSLAEDEMKRPAGGGWTCMISCVAECGTEYLSVDGPCEPPPTY
jgi:hypothetical protein